MSESLKIDEWKLEGEGRCDDCVEWGTLYRQPWRGVALCRSCWCIDTKEEDKEDESTG